MQSKVRYIARKEKPIKRVLLFLFLILLVECIWPLWKNTVADPYTQSMGISGQYSLIFLLLCLLITPLRRWLTILSQRLRLSYGKRLADWNFIIRYRRRLGLFAAGFAFLHCVTYLWLDMGFLVEEIIWDVQQRTFIQLGWLSLTVFFVLTITSPMFIQKKLKRKWRTIHRSVYLLGIVVMLHFSESLKAGDNRDYIWWGLMLLLLFHRLIFNFYIDRLSHYDNGLETLRSAKKK